MKYIKSIYKKRHKDFFKILKLQKITKVYQNCIYKNPIYKFSKFLNYKKRVYDVKR